MDKEARKPLDGDRWSVSMPVVQDLEAALGTDGMTALVRTFVHADRLTSLAQFLNWNGDVSPASPPSALRNYHTVLWFSLATLTELGRTLAHLRTTLAKKGFKNFDHDPWPTLLSAQEWTDKFLGPGEIRNEVLHADDSVIKAGLESLGSVPQNRPITLIEGVVGDPLGTRLSLGDAALLMGIHAQHPQPEDGHDDESEKHQTPGQPDEPEVDQTPRRLSAREVIRRAGEDHGKLAVAVVDALRDLVEHLPKRRAVR